MREWSVVVAALAAGVLAAALGAGTGCEEEKKLTLGMTVPKHQVYFPINPGAPHALGAASQNGTAISCDACHAGAQSFDEPLCMVCHINDDRAVQAVHAGIAGFRLFDVSCFGCHPKGDKGSELGVEDHSLRDFPINPTDPHGDAAYQASIPAGKDQCTACHLDVESQPTVALCEECHRTLQPPLESIHGGLLTSFAADSTHCKECHYETPVDPAVVPISKHANIFDQNHHAAVCKNCHATYASPPKEWAIEFGIESCTGCHNHGPECNPGNQSVCVQ